MPLSITGTTANQPVASGSTIRPFNTTELTDFRSTNGYAGMFGNPVVTITLTDAGKPSDADGLLSGEGLSKTGVGTYTISSIYSYDVPYYLDQLVFTPTAVPAGATRTTAFELSATDPSYESPTDDKTTSVEVIGPIAAPSPPLIAGLAATQTVAPGNAISPFNGVTVSDTNTAPMDSATITVTGGGALAGTGLMSNGSNVYTIAAATPAALTTTLDAISFVPPATVSTIPSRIALAIVDGQQMASASTNVQQVAAPVIPAPVPVTAGTTPQGGNFTVADETTGQQSYASGSAYSGPVQGLTDQFILVTPDNLNITSHVAGSFIHSGAGNDAIDVSKAGGNNILDGSTGSNFLTGGTGDDTFYLDDRALTSDVFSTVVGFHSGDNVSTFGVNATDFKINMLDNQGAVGSKGLDYAFTEAGHPNANVVIAGYTVADLSNGRLTATFGTTPDTPGLPGSQYLNIHAN